MGARDDRFDIYDHRGARSTSLDEDDLCRDYFVDPAEDTRGKFLSVRHALSVRALLILIWQSRCSLAAVDAGHGGGDPTAIADAIGNISVWMRGLTPEEEYALDLEITETNLPVAHSHKAAANPRRDRGESKCEKMALKFGGRWHEQKLLDVVADGYEKVHAAMERVGALV